MWTSIEAPIISDVRPRPLRARVGQAELALQHPEAARVAFTRALAVGEKTLPDDHMDLVVARLGLGESFTRSSITPKPPRRLPSMPSPPPMLSPRTA